MNSESTETYQLETTTSFLKSLKRLKDKEAERRILEKVEDLKYNPYMDKKLKAELKELWELRVGDYRVIHLVDKANKKVFLLEAGRRGAIFKGI